MDHELLNTELTTDPAHLGYGPLVKSGNDQGIATLLNAPNAGPVAISRTDNASFVSAFLPCLPAIAGLQDSAKKEMYWKIWDAILAMPQITFSNPNVSGMLAVAVADGIVTQEQAQSFLQRQGSRAEILFGAGVVVTTSDVSFALRGQR